MKPRRKIRRRRALNPTDRNYGSKKNLPPELLSLWEDTYEAAMKYYGDKKFSEGAAWRAVRWESGRERMPNPGWRTIPNPGDTIILGKLIEYATLENPPQMRVVKFHRGKEPDLLWSREHKMLVAFPGIEIPEERICQGPVDNATGQCRNLGKYQHLAKEYVKWSQRYPRGIVQVDIPAYKINPIGPADTVVYRSSKWTPIPGDPPGSQEYIHQFGENVMLSLGRGETPNAIVFQGGKLDVLPAGIVN